FHSLWCLGAQRKGMVINMNRRRNRRRTRRRRYDEDKPLVKNFFFVYCFVCAVLLATVAGSTLSKAYGTILWDEYYPTFVFAGCLLAAFWFIGNLIKFRNRVLVALAAQLLAAILIPIGVVIAFFLLKGFIAVMTMLGNAVQGVLIGILGTIVVVVIIFCMLTGMDFETFLMLYVLHNIFKNDDDD
ncbi:MAG: hypothetical protein LUG55_02180, partial [Clostridiales bacterium]|nr:hypothetical protein [Clostridiales bacterium]